MSASSSSASKVIMNSTLTERITEPFDQQDVRLFVADDPDNLLVQEEPMAALLAHQLTILPLESPVEFRYLYETGYRRSKERLVVLTHHGVHHVPVDILADARLVTADLASLFPHLATDVLRQLPYRALARLYEAQGHQSADLTRRETAKVVAEKGYNIAADAVSSGETLYGALLRLHLNEEPLPGCIADYVIETWRQNPAFDQIPLERLVRNRRAFLDYLQNHWNAWASSLPGVQVTGIAEPSLVAAYTNAGTERPATTVPWKSLQVRSVVDDYFEMGLIKPVRVISRDSVPDWALPGVSVDESEAIQRGIDRLTALLDDPARSWDVGAWDTVATDLGSLLARYYTVEQADSGLTRAVDALMHTVDERFGEWLRSSYDTSLSLAYLPRPVSVHQIAPYLAGTRRGRTALVVMDGMNWWQWHLVARGLEQQRLRVSDLASVLACIPTITPVSRPAIFGGALPRSFFHADRATDEAALWSDFWSRNGLAAEHTALDIVGPTSNMACSLDKALPPSVLAFAAVVPKVDELIHGEGLDLRMLASTIRTWINGEELATYLSGLLDAGYDVYVTADHGNTCARGIGLHGTGVLAERNGQRARIFSSRVLRDNFVQENGQVAEPWDSTTLPDDVHVALCRGNGAFAPNQQALNCHGGISLLEVMVPFARISREA